MPSVMTVAGSDSGAGAGIQADLKTFAALGVYGTSAITAVTAQNTLGVVSTFQLPPATVEAQINAIVDDIGADAVKTGVLGSNSTVQVVAEVLRRHSLGNIVVDPVMVANSGHRLLAENALDSLRQMLLPQAAVVTPNVPEAEKLAGCTIETSDDIRMAARQIVSNGAKAVVITGGHMPGPLATDLLYDGLNFEEFTVPRVGTAVCHGTGCTFASAVAAGLAQGCGLSEAVGQAKRYVTESLLQPLPFGSGDRPLNHLFRLQEN